MIGFVDLGGWDGIGCGNGSGPDSGFFVGAREGEYTYRAFRSSSSEFTYTRISNIYSFFFLKNIQLTYIHSATWFEEDILTETI